MLRNLCRTFFIVQNIASNKILKLMIIPILNISSVLLILISTCCQLKNRFSNHLKSHRIRIPHAKSRSRSNNIRSNNKNSKRSHINNKSSKTRNINNKNSKRSNIKNNSNRKVRYKIFPLWFAHQTKMINIFCLISNKN